MLEKAKAEEARGNQEESYIFFMKYLNVITFVQTSQKTKKVSDIQVSKRALQYALEAAERLSQCLQKRYIHLLIFLFITQRVLHILFSVTSLYGFLLVQTIYVLCGLS